MQLTKKQKIYAGITAFLLILIITNPSVTAFKTYIGKTDYNYRETSNFFIFSKYRWINGNGGSYIGILGNFYYQAPRRLTHKDSADLKILPENIIDTTLISYIDIKKIPYRERVYFALRDNLKDFNTPLSEFDEKIKDKEYDMKVYTALKDNLQGFNKTPQEFVSLINQ